MLTWMIMNNYSSKYLYASQLHPKRTATEDRITRIIGISQMAGSGNQLERSFAQFPPSRPLGNVFVRRPRWNREMRNTCVLETRNLLKSLTFLVECPSCPAKSATCWNLTLHQTSMWQEANHGPLFEWPPCSKGCSPANTTPLVQALQLKALSLWLHIKLHYHQKGMFQQRHLAHLGTAFGLYWCMHHTGLICSVAWALL